MKLSQRLQRQIIKQLGTEQVRPSVATYRDGEPRDWQPGDENPYQKLFKAKR